MTTKNILIKKKDVVEIKMMKLWYKLGTFWDSITDIPYFIKKVFSYIPVLWREYDWDAEVSLLKIIKFKVSRIRKLIEENKRHEDWEKDVANMITLEAMIDRYLSDILFDECYDDFWYRPENQLMFKPAKDGECFGEVETLPEKSEEEWKARSNAYNRLKEDEWEEIFLFMKDNLRNWWD